MSTNGNSDIVAPTPSEEFKKQSDNIQNLSEISKNSRTTFMAILLAGAYCYLTIGTTTDAGLLSNLDASPLPIIQAQVPIVWFYYFAPLILFLLFVYFHSYLQRFWRCVAVLPLRHVEDGRTLDDYIYPWLISSAFLRAEIAELRKIKKSYIPLESAISIFLAWWFIPLILVFFWARFLVAHDLKGTLLHIVLIVVSVAGAIWFYYAAKNEVAAHVSQPKAPIYKHPNVLTALGAFASLILLGFLSFGAMEGAPEADCRASELPQCSVMYSGARLMELVGYTPFANIEGRKLTNKPDDWLELLNSKNAEERIEGITGPMLKNKDLRFTNGKNAFMVRADLRRARMQQIKLDNAVLVKANLEKAKLDGGTLNNANLQWVDLTDARLPKADLTQANLQQSRLIKAYFFDSFLTGANLSNAIGTEVDFTDADLRSANLTKAEFPRATMVGSELQKAVLANAQFESSNFDNASMQYSDFSDATITNSSFRDAGLQNAIFKNAYVDDSVFRSADLEAADMEYVSASGVTFTDANLMTATLSNADLREAEFTNSDLTDVNLDGANLANAVFDNTKLVRVNFGQSGLYETVIKNSDLSGAILTDTKGFELAKLDGSCGDEYTKLPAGHTIPLCQEKTKTTKDVAELNSNP